MEKYRDKEFVIKNIERDDAFNQLRVYRKSWSWNNKTQYWRFNSAMLTKVK